MGKVHGSLARAGKVKSQTPKVGFQEDKIPIGVLPKHGRFDEGPSGAIHQYIAEQTLIWIKMTGRASREEEDSQGPCQEENILHPPICERHNDWWKEEGLLLLILWKI